MFNFYNEDKSLFLNDSEIEYVSGGKAKFQMDDDVEEKTQLGTIAQDTTRPFKKLFNIVPISKSMFIGFSLSMIAVILLGLTVTVRKVRAMSQTQVQVPGMTMMAVPSMHGGMPSPFTHT